MEENAEYICFLHNLHKDLYKNDLFFGSLLKNHYLCSHKYGTRKNDPT